MKHLGYLIAGVVLTLLFIMSSFTYDFNIYDKIFYRSGFSEQMFNTQTYPVIAIITAITAWGGAAIYYFVINSVKFDRWYHWLAMMAVVVVLTPVICYFYNDSVFTGYGLSYTSESAAFEMWTVVFTALLYVVASYSMRWWSSNCRHTPIPQ